MILKALYDYYHRCGNLPAAGMEEKEIGFLIVISKAGKFIRFEDCRIDNNKSARTYLVTKHVGRSSAPLANYLYDNSAYVLGISERKIYHKLKEQLENFVLTPENEQTFLTLKRNFENEQEECFGKEQKYFDTFKAKVASIRNQFPNNPDIKAVYDFYEQGRDAIIEAAVSDPLWDDIKKNLSKKYSTFSFRIEGDTQIVAEKRELMQLDSEVDKEASLCLITGKHGTPVEVTTATMIPGSQAIAKLVAFQINSGYDSYGKKKCGNAPISSAAEFAYSTALNTLLAKDSHNKFMVGNRTFVFWASANDRVSDIAEQSFFDLLGFTSKDESEDDPNAKIENARKVFMAIYSGKLNTTLDNRFCILGLAPNSARIAVVYWSETSLKDFAEMILRHFDDMALIDNSPNPKPYMGVKDMLSAVTHRSKQSEATPNLPESTISKSNKSGKQSEVTPNLPEAVIKSVFQGLPYPYTLFTSCIHRLKAESSNKAGMRIGRIAILKAYLNRINDPRNSKIQVMLDKDNTNQGYLCGRLFAVLDKVQEDANHINSIRERYMNAASSTPATVFATILNLSTHHAENLKNEGSKVYYEKLKQEIISKISADGFPAHLNLQDQGRFFVGYYHQRQDFFTKKEDSNKQ